MLTRFYMMLVLMMNDDADDDDTKLNDFLLIMTRLFCYSSFTSALLLGSDDSLVSVVASPEAAQTL